MTRRLTVKFMRQTKINRYPAYGPFLHIIPLFEIGYISEGERSTVKQQWKIYHNFQGSIMQDLPHLRQFAHNRLQNRPTALYSHYREIEDVKSGSVLSGFEPATLRSKRRFVAPLANRLFWPCFFRHSSALVKWLSSRMYVQAPCGRSSRAWIAPDPPCTLYPSKQHRPHC